MHWRAIFDIRRILILKNMLATLMLVFGFLLLSAFTLFVIIGIVMPDSGLTLDLIITMAIVLLVPGGLLFFAGKKIRRNHITKPIDPASVASFNPVNTESIQAEEQVKQESATTSETKQSNGSNTRTSFSVTSSSSTTSEANETFSKIFDAFFGENKGRSAEASATKEPASVNCPSCGARVTTYPNQLSPCDYCGTKVPYKEV